MAITIGATISDHTSTVASSITTLPHTVDAGGDSYLVLIVGAESELMQALPTWNGTETMTLLGDTSADTSLIDLYMYGLVNPTAGTADIVIDHENGYFCIVAMNIFGVDQTTPTGTVVSAGNDTTQATSADITGFTASVDKLIVSAYGNRDLADVPPWFTPLYGETKIYDDRETGKNLNMGAQYNLNLATTGVQFGDGTFNRIWDAIGVEINAVEVIGIIGDIELLFTVTGNQGIVP